MTDLVTRVREYLTTFADQGYDERPDGYDAQLHAALLAAIGPHAPIHYDGQVQYEYRDEPVFSADGAPMGHVRVRGDALSPDWCAACSDVTPCDELRAIAAALGIEVDRG